MSSGGWRYASASVIGTSHIKSNTECQDAHVCEVVPTDEGEVLVAVVSDGAGSAEMGGEGASLFCETVRAAIADDLRKQAGFLPSRSYVERLLEAFVRRVQETADGIGRSLRDFACTGLAAIVRHNTAAFFQVGDGCVVIKTADDPEYQWVFWPERGEYENATYFVTSDQAQDHLQFSSTTGVVTHVAMFTDGLQRLALDLNLQLPYPKFFDGMFPPLAEVASGPATELSSALTVFLASDRVNDRTDDDKTLIIASRPA